MKAFKLSKTAEKDEKVALENCKFIKSFLLPSLLLSKGNFPETRNIWGRPFQNAPGFKCTELVLALSVYVLNSIQPLINTSNK